MKVRRSWVAVAVPSGLLQVRSSRLRARGTTNFHLAGGRSGSSPWVDRRCRAERVTSGMKGTPGGAKCDGFSLGWLSK
ncbi:hypothetical protein STH2418 [Symbiobacterium thermophilum IAM 14863]|uniref:Uncharacterized protein n=1 Tax=Symbiobacterium thermophilum (strain DSM 24528 / JCM 14929 / IAM 14863 / T) TaxID=292459 RepID=Q67LP3_SYMTH|nr:hypothetical protein STH2418 [Symbiobacterium thermophilum IAM 14863]